MRRTLSIIVIAIAAAAALAAATPGELFGVSIGQTVHEAETATGLRFQPAEPGSDYWRFEPDDGLPGFESYFVHLGNDNLIDEISAIDSFDHLRRLETLGLEERLGLQGIPKTLDFSAEPRVFSVAWTFCGFEVVCAVFATFTGVCCRRTDH